MTRIDAEELLDAAQGLDPAMRESAQATAIVLIAAALRALIGLAVVATFLLAVIVGVLLAR